jgi:asparagine synthetase B (glutamine-hydrolysing)
VVDTAFSVPMSLKIHRGKEKYILRRALRSMVSPELLAIPKFPMRMKYDDEFAEQLDGLADKYLSPEQVRSRGVFEPESITAIRSYKRKGRYHAEAAMRVWTAVVTEIWAQQFIDNLGSLVLL